MLMQTKPNAMSNVISRNNVKITGKGEQPLLFVHGYGCDQNMWRFMAPAFEEDYKVVLIDLVGSGNSDLSAFDPMKYSSLNGYASDLIEICDELKLSDVIIVGHSVSAMIGGLATIQRNDLFHHLIMIGPSPCYINDSEYTGGFNRKDIEELMEVMEHNYLGWSSSLAPAIMANPDRPELGEELTNSFCKMDPSIAKQFAKTTFLTDHRSDLKKIKTPTLILQCSEDIIAPEVVGEYVHQNITNSQFVKMNATGHCPNLSSPEETTSFIKSYLSMN